MKSNIQVTSERARAVFEASGQPALLAQVCAVHGISVRDFAAIFDISKTFAGEIINHEKLPSLELAVRISRYWECTVEDLFGWRIDDTGARRPLLVIDPETGKMKKLVGKDRTSAVDMACMKRALELMEEIERLKILLSQR